MIRQPARCGAGRGSRISAVTGNWRRISSGQPTLTEMFPAPPSLAPIAAMRLPASPIETRISLRSGNGSFTDMLDLGSRMVLEASRWLAYSMPSRKQS